jgi:hypothetical protein
LGLLEDKYRREYTDWLENLASFIKKWEVSFSHSYLWKTFEQWHCAGSRHILEFFLISLSLGLETDKCAVHLSKMNWSVHPGLKICKIFLDNEDASMLGKTHDKTIKLWVNLVFYTSLSLLMDLIFWGLLCWHLTHALEKYQNPIIYVKRISIPYPAFHLNKLLMHHSKFQKTRGNETYKRITRIAIRFWTTHHICLPINYCYVKGFPKKLKKT